MNAIQVVVSFLGRILLSAIFLASSAREMMDWEQTEQYLSQHVDSWSMLYATDQTIIDFIEILRPWLPWILLIAIGLKLLGSLMMILGWHVRIGAFFLVLFLLPVTLFMHDFWHLVGSQQAIELEIFLRNLAILGGLFVVLAFGKGLKSTPAPKKVE